MSDTPQAAPGTDTDVTTSAAPTTGRAPRRRRGIVSALIVLATIVGVLAVAALWVNRQVLNTENWTTTSSKMLADPTIRNTLAAYMVDQIFENVDVAGQLEQ